MLHHFTEQGIRNVKQTVERAKSFKEMAEEMGCKVKEIYWVMGPYDGCLIIEAPDAETITAVALKAGSLGNIRTTTMRLYDMDEMSKILARV